MSKAILIVCMIALCLAMVSAYGGFRAPVAAPVRAQPAPVRSQPAYVAARAPTPVRAAPVRVRAAPARKVIGRASPIAAVSACQAGAIRQCGSSPTHGPTACRAAFVAKCEHKANHGGRTSDKNCQAGAIRKCGSSPTNGPTACRAAYITKCQTTGKHGERSPTSCQAGAVRKCGSSPTNGPTACRATYIAQCQARSHGSNGRRHHNFKRHHAKKHHAKKHHSKRHGGRRSNSSCQAGAIRKCGTSPTNGPTACRAAYIASCETRGRTTHHRRPVQSQPIFVAQPAPVVIQQPAPVQPVYVAQPQPVIDQPFVAPQPVDVAPQPVDVAPQPQPVFVAPAQPVDVAPVAPVQPVYVAPAQPVDVAPVAPAQPVAPAPVDVAPVQPVYVAPAPATPVDVAPVQPAAPVQPVYVAPAPVDVAPVQPVYVAPAPVTPSTNAGDGVWRYIDFDRDGAADLVFIKYANTPSGNVEVHVASASSNYQTRIFESATTFANEVDGTWRMADYDRDGVPDLVFIKTSNTPSGNVEVHVASAASNFQTRIFESATTFANEVDGVWVMADYDRDGIPDLVFIKTSNTPSGNVEVHVASASSNYQTRIFESATTFVNEVDGVWRLTDFDRDGIPDLVFIKWANTPAGNIEVHVASASSNYQTRIFESGTTFALENNGSWRFADYDKDGVPDLCYVKIASTPSNFVEVHVASAASNFQTRIFESATTFANEGSVDV